MTDSITHFTITNTTKGRLPRLPFSRLKEEVFGKKYALSLVFVSDARARELNKKHRGKNEPANVLSFPLSSKEGEICIAPGKAKTDAPIFKMPYRRFVFFLFIHALLHLKGFRHGGTMEKKEAQLLRESNV